MWQRFKVWRVKLSERFEAYKYRNVDLNDPEVRKKIKESEQGLKEDVWYASFQVYISIIFAILLIAYVHLFK